MQHNVKNVARRFLIYPASAGISALFNFAIFVNIFLRKTKSGSPSGNCLFAR
jgi:hypothetical protein